MNRIYKYLPHVLFTFMLFICFYKFYELGFKKAERANDRLQFDYWLLEKKLEVCEMVNEKLTQPTETKE